MPPWRGGGWGKSASKSRPLFLRIAACLRPSLSCVLEDSHAERDFDLRAASGEVVFPLVHSLFQAFRYVRGERRELGKESEKPLGDWGEGDAVRPFINSIYPAGALQAPFCLLFFTISLRRCSIFRALPHYLNAWNRLPWTIWGKKGQLLAVSLSRIPLDFFRSSLSVSSTKMAVSMIFYSLALAFVSRLFRGWSPFPKACFSGNLVPSVLSLTTSLSCKREDPVRVRERTLGTRLFLRLRQSRAQSFSGSLSAVGRRDKLWDNGFQFPI